MEKLTGCKSARGIDQSDKKIRLLFNLSFKVVFHKHSKVLFNLHLLLLQIRHFEHSFLSRTFSYLTQGFSKTKLQPLIFILTLQIFAFFNQFCKFGKHSYEVC
jgi:hypothetical protein